MSIVAVVNITESAALLKEPFTLLELAHVDELSTAVYVCQGAMGWHRHLDEDELFLVLSGLITLESEWGAVTLAPWELALVPKGVGHRSLSAKWSFVLLFRLRMLANRQNGHGRIHGVPGQETLHKVSIADALAQVRSPYQPRLLANVAHYRLSALHCWGASPWAEQKPGAGLFIGRTGAVLVETDEGEAAPLGTNELVMLSRGTRYRITAAQPAAILRVSREASSAAPPSL